MLPTHPRAARRSITATAPIAPLLSGSLFFAAALLGLMLSRDTDGIAAVWPANAILVSALALAAGPAHKWPVSACAIAGLAANWIEGVPLGLASVFAVANVLASRLAFALLGERRGSSRLFDDPAFLLRFVRAAACGAAAGATVGGLGLCIATGSFVVPWLSWAASDFLGMLLITPLVRLALGRLPAPGGLDRRTPVGARMWPLALVLVASTLVFEQSRFPLLFLPMVMVMVATYRLGLLGAAGGT